MNTLRKQFAVELNVADHERAVLARISTATVDRDGEVLLSQGCDATEFFKSPTVFFNHDYAQPVGKCVAITRHRTSLEAKTVFATRPSDHHGPWLPDTVLALLQQGVIKGFSVGFVPVEGRRPSRLDRETYGPSARYVYTKWKLLEYSVAPLPANQDALALAVSKGKVNLEHVKALLPSIEMPPLPIALSKNAPARKRIVLLVPGLRPRRTSADELVQQAMLKARGSLYA